MIDRIIIVPLFGNVFEFTTCVAAMAFVDSFDETRPVGDFRKYEVIVRFKNGEKLTGEFLFKDRVTEFLGFAQKQPNVKA